MALVAASHVRGSGKSRGATGLHNKVRLRNFTCSNECSLVVVAVFAKKFHRGLHVPCKQSSEKFRIMLCPRGLRTRTPQAQKQVVDRAVVLVYNGIQLSRFSDKAV